MQGTAELDGWDLIHPADMGAGDVDDKEDDDDAAACSEPRLLLVAAAFFSFLRRCHYCI